MKVLKSGSKLLFAILLATALGGCSKVSTPSVYVPTAADVTATATLADLQAGRILFINNCARCHALPIPDDHSVSQWKSILPGMTSRCSLTTAQVTQLTKYVTRGN